MGTVAFSETQLKFTLFFAKGFDLVQNFAHLISYFNFLHTRVVFHTCIALAAVSSSEEMKMQNIR